MTTEPTKTSETTLEKTALDWFEALGLQTAFNPDIPADAIDDAIRLITRTDSPSPIESSRRFNRMLTDGVDVSYSACLSTMNSWSSPTAWRPGAARSPADETGSCRGAPSTEKR